jgi:hypothetical protein
MTHDTVPKAKKKRRLGWTRPLTHVYLPPEDCLPGEHALLPPKAKVCTCPQRGKWCFTMSGRGICCETVVCDANCLYCPYYQEAPKP